ncbi:hypothetical protein HOY80DRAFT_996390 [Tuber brumale]|nr:hypothetical protein HOY80DRAFT_996390 [Tuber brumale]
MGYGSVERHGLIICTNSYSIEDIVRLMNSSIPLLRTIVTPYLHSSMLYKITSMSYKKSSTKF